MKNITICVPTYNRAKSLEVCLQYLAGFSSLDFELVVGNNCSTDDGATEAVVNRYKEVFPHYRGVNRRENIGWTRNMDSLLRMATRKYIYILCDDDLVFESALGLMSSIMEANPQVATITGQYVSVRKPDVEMRIDYSDAAVTIVQQNDHASLLHNLSLCDAHPFLRRELFTRYGTYQDRTSALIPLYMRMLSQGNLLVINKPIFQHLTTTDSLTTGMTEAWFIDMGMCDLELCKAMLGDVPGWSLWEHKARLSQLFYFQAARMAWNKKDFALLWLFLNRSRAIDAIGDELLVKCEYSFMHEVVVGRLARLIEDSACDSVHCIPSPLVHGVLDELKARCSGVNFVEAGPEGCTDARLVVLSDSITAETLSLYPGAIGVAMQDVFQFLRLTRFPALLTVADQRLGVGFVDPAAIVLLTENSGSFQRLCNVYSSEP